MNHILAVFFLGVFFTPGIVFSQIKVGDKKFKPSKDRLEIKNDTTRGGLKSNKSKGVIKGEKAKIEDYIIINSERDTIAVDTSLTLKKYFKFNYLRKNYLELMPFFNVGQSFNSLSYQKENVGKTIPIFGARARHFNYFEIEDTPYYKVPTPFTELFYKTAFEQGQILDAQFAVNVSPQLNLSIGYKGLRSLGKYQHHSTSTGNFRFTFNYVTKNNRYLIRAHMVTQDLSNEENGGLSDEDIINFETGVQDFKNRKSFSPLMEDAENKLLGRRFYADQIFYLNPKHDSLPKGNLFFVENKIFIEDRSYTYNQTAANSSLFGVAFNSTINDKTKSENFSVHGLLGMQSKNLGDWKIGIQYDDYNYGYDKITVLNNNTIPNRIQLKNTALALFYDQNIGKFSLKAEGKYNVSGAFSGTFAQANLSYDFNKENTLQAQATYQSSLPQWNTLLYQSTYQNYNWHHANQFKNENNVRFNVGLNSSKWGNWNATLHQIENYTYFHEPNPLSITPTQSDDKVSYIKVKAQKEFNFSNFYWDNSVIYQKVASGENQLPLPEWIGQSTLYYANHFFKKNALYLQTGVTAKYFTSYYMNAYNPVLAEFYVQNQTKIGDFPLMDFFINAKIRQTRIYFLIEHFNSNWTGYNFYSAPGYPYRDASIRFGVVWNFFL